MKMYLLQLKSQLMEMQEELRRRLKNLASACDTVEKQLEKRVKIAEIILTFAEMCRKLEAEEEKILPFYASTLTEEERAEVQAAFSEQPFEELAKVFRRPSTSSLIKVLFCNSRTCTHMIHWKLSGNVSVKSR